MKLGLRLALAVLVATVFLIPAPTAAWAGRASLPSVASGPNPGPPILYASAAHTPILTNTGRWDARPILVSGAEAYRHGEYLYQDYLYDDYGANTTNAQGADPEPRPASSELLFGGQTGDVVYPKNKKIYGFNAADLVELRVEPRHHALAYRFTLNTLLAKSSTAIAVGIDTDGGRQPTKWRYHLGALGPLDLEHVLFTDGARALVDGRAVHVTTSLKRNQIEVVVPDSILDPDGATWRHYAVTGIASKRGFARLMSEPSKTRPGGSHDTDAPPIFNVAFRFEADGDEPIGKDRSELGSRTVGYGHWREHGQAIALAARNIKRFHADIDFSKLRAGTHSSNAPRHGYMNRIYVSHLNLGEGVANERPWLLGRLQPYTLYVPKSYTRGRPAPFQLVLHSLACTYNQFKVFSPHTYRDLGKERDAIVLTTMGRGPDGWYHHEAETDVFEAWADVARHYDLDPERVGINGYSMGGYGTFKLTAQYPDLFGKAFPVVGPPGEGIYAGAGDTVDAESNTLYILENFLNVPLLIWDGAADELVPVAGTTRHVQQLDDLGYRYIQDVFASDHFALGEVDDWDRGKEFLGQARVNRNPRHVVYKVMPGADVPELGLVHDHAYWVWDVTIREEEGDPATGLVDAQSLVPGLGRPPTERVAGAGVEPLPHTERGIIWGPPPEEDSANALEVRLVNIAAATLGVTRAGLNTAAEIELEVTSDGDATLQLHGDWLAGTRVVDGQGDPVAFSLEGKSLAFSVGDGKSVLRIVPGN
ncbi:MAG: prolyl oligopeptidase family serine peptidase [Actinomycetota bacterium]